ncbi:MAG: tetratricopeptide repeat protein [Candidatus Thorarchaeota archaeon]|jgi:Flp pilus assembly protein TadD
MTGILERAVAAIQDGRFAEALPLLEKASKAENPDPEILVYLGMVYVQLEKPGNAVEVLERVQEQVEDYCVVSLFLGRALYGLGRFEEAATELRKALSMDPGHFEGWTDLSNVLLATREFGEAAHVLRNALEHFPNEPALLSLHATSLHMLGDYTGAAHEWSKVCKLEPDSLIALSNFAYLLLLQKRISEAETTIRRAEKLDPTDCRLKILRAEIHIQKEQFGEAETYLMKAIEGDSCYSPALARLAVISHQQNDEVSFRDYLNRTGEALTEEPRRWWALFYVYRLIGWKNKIVDVLTEGTKEDSGSAAPWVALASHYQDQGMSEDAEHAWRMSFRIRRYVKLHCNECGNDMHIPYNQAAGFDLHKTQVCTSCDRVIVMPQGLAAI